jgi:ABC-type transporter Mla subunit MlaD
VSLAENRGVWFGVAGLALVVALILWLLAGAQPFRLVVLFEDTGNLKKEDPVVWKSYEIGKVEEIRPLVENKIGVTIRIREDYAPNISRGSEFHLKRAAFLGLVGRDGIEVITPPTPGKPFSSGERVHGISGPKPSLLKDSKELGLQYWNQLKEEANRLLEDYKNSPIPEDLEQAAAQIRELAAAGAQQATETVESFSRNHRKEIESLLESLKKLKERLLRAGDLNGAKQIGKQIETLEEGIRP